MRHQEKIPSLGHGDSAVNNCARLNITIVLLIGSLLFRRIQAIMMVLANNNEGDLGLDPILEDLCASSSYCWYLFTQHSFVLTFGHA